MQNHARDCPSNNRGPDNGERNRDLGKNGNRGSNNSGFQTKPNNNNNQRFCYKCGQPGHIRKFVHSQDIVTIVIIIKIQH